MCHTAMGWTATAVTGMSADTDRLKQHDTYKTIQILISGGTFMLTVLARRKL
jgi:hypothetical protein